MKPVITGLDDYGLTLSDLETLAPRRVTYGFALRRLTIEKLIPLSVRDRVTARSEHLRRSFSLVERRFQFDSLEPENKKNPGWSEAISGVQTFAALARSRYVEFLSVRRIAGLRKRRRQARPPSFFCVRVRVALQVEGQTSGLQEVEDRFVLVKARSFKHAEERLRPEWERYAQPYINLEGELVRWQLEEVVDVYDVMEDTVDPEGTEVYSSFSFRRMKPEYEWHPSRRRRAHRPSAGGINRRR